MVAYPCNRKGPAFKTNYPNKPPGAIWPAAQLRKKGHVPVAFAMDADSGRPNENDPVWISQGLLRQHLADIAPTGGGKTTMQTQRAVAGHFASNGPSFYFCGPGRHQVPEDVIAAIAAMPDMAPSDVADHVEVITPGLMTPGLTFGDLRKYKRAVRDRTARRGATLTEEEIRQRAIGNFRDHFAEFIRVAARDSRDEQHSRPLYQLLHLAPELAFDSDYRDLDVVPSRARYEVCPVSDLVTIMRRVGFYVRTEQYGRLPVGELDLKAANMHLAGLLNYGAEVLGNIVSGAITRVMSVLKHGPLQEMLDNTHSRFSLHDALDTETLYVIDTSSLERTAQPLATLTFLNELYLATQQRQQWVADQAYQYTINVLLDEAPRMIGFEPVQEWMAEARNNRIGLDFTLQTDQQFAEVGEEHLIEEMRTNFGTILCRAPNADDALAQMFRKPEHETMNDIKLRLRDIAEYDRLILSERFEGEPGTVQSRRPTKKVSYYPGAPPDWHPTSDERRATRETGPNPWGDIDLPPSAAVDAAVSADRYAVDPDDPYPFDEAALDHAIETVCQQTEQEFGLTPAERKTVRGRRTWEVPVALQAQYDLTPGNIDAAVAIATAHERRSARGADGWVSEPYVIERLHYWQALGSLSGDDEDGDGDGDGEGATGGVQHGRQVPSSRDDWQTVLKQQPTVDRRSGPPDAEAWTASDGPADAPVVRLTDYGTDLWSQHETVGIGVKAGDDHHTRLLERGVAPFRQLQFEGGVVSQRPGDDQVDARLFRPGTPRLHGEAESRTLNHPAKLGADIAAIQDANAFPVLLAPMVGPDGDEDRPDDYWAEQVWTHYLHPVIRTDETDDADTAVKYYTHRNTTIDFDGGAENGGWTAARPLDVTREQTDDEDGDASDGGDGDEDGDEREPSSASTGATAPDVDRDADVDADADAAARDGPPADDTDEDSVADGDTGPVSGPGPWTVEKRAAERQTVWRYEDGAYVLRDGTGEEHARLNGFTTPRLGAFPARYRNRTANDDDAADEYEVQVKAADGSWQIVETYSQKSVMKDDFVPVKQPFVPEAHLEHPPTTTGAAVLYVDTDPAVDAAEAEVKWYDGRQKTTGRDTARSIPELVAALESGDLAPATGDWSSRTRPPSKYGPTTDTAESGTAAAGGATAGDATASTDPDATAASDAGNETPEGVSISGGRALPGETGDDTPALPAAENSADANPLVEESSSAAGDVGPASAGERSQGAGEEPVSVSDSFQQTFDEMGAAAESDGTESESVITAFTPVADRVAPAVSPDHPIPARVVVAVFANTNLLTPADIEEGDSTPTANLYPIFTELFEPFLDALPIEGHIDYPTFKDHLEALLPDVEIKPIKDDHELRGAAPKRSENRPGAEQAAKHLGVAAYVDDGIVVGFDARAALPVAFEQGTAFARALGLVPDADLDADTQVYETHHFERMVEWYIRHLVYPGAPSTTAIETTRVRNHTLPDRYTDDQGRAYCWDYLQLAATSTAVPEDPPPQPHTETSE